MAKKDEIRSWDRQPGETDKYWRNFQEYRDLGSNRTLEKAARNLGIRGGSMTPASHKWNWRKRCEDFDRWVDQEAQLDSVQAVRAMRRRQIETALAMQNLGNKAVEKLEQFEANSAKTGKGLHADEARQMIEAGVKIERVNRGEPDVVQRVELEDKEPDELTDEELMAIARKGKEP